jgi:negative regulator of replication initiation
MRDPMVSRTIKVPRELWDAVKAKADEHGERISEVIRRWLEFNDSAVWQAFVARCHEQGKSATDVLLELIAKWMRRKP